MVHDGSTIVRYTDDLDGSDASGPVDFALDGREYEIDLNDENAAKLREEVFAPFIAAAAGRTAVAGDAPPHPW